MEKLEFSYKRKLFISFTFEMIKYILLSPIQKRMMIWMPVLASFIMHFLSRDYMQKKNAVHVQKIVNFFLHMLSLLFPLNSFHAKTEKKQFTIVK